MNNLELKHDFYQLKLRKIDALLTQTRDSLIEDLEKMEKGSLDHLQMQTYLLGFQQCLTITLGIIHD